MSPLDKYVQDIRKNLDNLHITNEIEIVRYIYLDLGKNLSFDPKYIPFGNSRYRQNLYKYQSHNVCDLNECMEKHTAICKSIAYILRYLYSKFNIETEVCIDQEDIRKNKHMYNLVKLKDGRNIIIDLQEDIRNIQLNYFTTGFGLDFEKPENYLICYSEIMSIDKKLNYITDKKPYTDEYLLLLHQLVDGISDFNTKLEIILENIDPYDTSHMGYTDRQWNHKRVFEEFFSEEEFNYDDFKPGKIRFVDCHIVEDGNLRYICFLQILDGKNYSYYIYNEKEYKYEKISIDEIAKMYDGGLIMHKTTFYGLISYLRQRKNS